MISSWCVLVIDWFLQQVVLHGKLLAFLRVNVVTILSNNLVLRNDDLGIAISQFVVEVFSLLDSWENHGSLNAVIGSNVVVPVDSSLVSNLVSVKIMVLNSNFFADLVMEAITP